MTGADDAVEALEATALTVPTDAPEGDGTLTWDATTVVLVQAHGGGSTGVGWTYGPPACAGVVHDLLADVALGRSACDVGAAFTAMVRAVRNASDAANGLLGEYFHARGVARKPGGWRLWTYNLPMGPPISAPGLMAMVGGMGLLASVLRRER